MPERDQPALGSRHLNFESLDTYWATRIPMEIPVPGEPVCRLHLDPGHDEISLLTPLVGQEPSLSRFRNIDLNTFAEDHESWAELRIRVAGSLHGAYSILVTVADRMQIGQESLAVAVPRAIAEHRGVLAGRVGLSEEQEIGLYGELLVLESLLHDGVKEATHAWAGPLSEEHDFTFVSAHVEVKTTSAERRRHMIGTLQQLEPVRGVPLWLLSIQLTRSSGAGGRALAQLVHDVRGISGERVIDVDDRLAAVGWDDDVQDLFTTVWTLRSTPRCYRVDESFPALTQDRLVQSVPQASFLSDVSYRVDVTDLDPSDVPPPLGGFMTAEGATQ